MPTGTPMPWVLEQFFDDAGDPVPGGLLFTYAAGTSTKLATYQDSGLLTAHTNPIIMDSAGRPDAAIFLQANSYKFVFAPAGDDDPPTSPFWTVDNVAATPPFNVDLDVLGTSGEALAAGECVYLSDGTGGRTSGTYYKADSDAVHTSTTARIVGFVITGAAAASGVITVRRMGRLTGLTGLTAGSVYYVSATAGGITSTAPSLARRVGQADTTTSLVIAAEITEPQKGYIALDLVSAREVVANVIPAIASPASGGILAADTTPALERVNGATDKQLRINWVAGNVDEIVWNFSYPTDWDDTQAVEVRIMAASAGATNSPVVTISYFEGVGDTNAGSATSAVTGTTPTQYAITIAASDVGAYPNFASIGLVPAAHATDALRLYAVGITYVKKLLAT